MHLAGLSAATLQNARDAFLARDVVLVQRGLYPPGVLGRTSPETTGIGVEQIRRIVTARAAYPAYEATRLVFIFRAAHELTANAANALLKTLE